MDFFQFQVKIPRKSYTGFWSAKMSPEMAVCPFFEADTQLPDWNQSFRPLGVTILTINGQFSYFWAAKIKAIKTTRNFFTLLVLTIAHQGSPAPILGRCHLKPVARATWALENVKNVIYLPVKARVSTKTLIQRHYRLVKKATFLVLNWLLPDMSTFWVVGWFFYH